MEFKSQRDVVFEPKKMGQFPMVIVDLWFLCHFCVKGHGFLKGYSWFSNYVIMAHVTRGCFLMGNLDTSPSKGVVSIYCEGVVLGSWLG